MGGWRVMGPPVCTPRVLQASPRPCVLQDFASRLTNFVWTQPRYNRASAVWPLYPLVLYYDGKDEGVKRVAHKDIGDIPVKVMENLFAKRLSTSTLIMSIGLGIRVVAQSLVFYIAARVLGAENYGLLSAIEALIFFFTPFANWGSGYILIKRISRSSCEFPPQWGTSLTLTFIMSAALLILLTLIVKAIYSAEIAIYVAIPLIFGDLLGLGLVTISSQAFQAYERFLYTSMTWAMLSMSRLVFSILFLVFPVAKNIENWAIFYGIGGLLAGVLMVLWVNKELGGGTLTLAGMKQEWINGFYFSVSVSAQGVYNNIDKTLLSKLATDSIAGVYAVTYRILDMVFIPIQGLIFVVFPRLFTEGGKGLSNVKYLALRLLPLAVGWGLFAWLGVSVLSPLLPVIFGDEYLQVQKMVILLGPILAFRAAHYIAANALAGADFQSWRSVVQIGIAVTNFLLNMWWIPLFGWKGAVWSSLISDGLLAVGLWLIFIWLEQRSGRIYAGIAL